MDILADSLKFSFTKQEVAMLCIQSPCLCAIVGGCNSHLFYRCRGFYSATPLSAFVPRLATPGSAQSSVLSLLPKSSETSIVPAMYYQQTRTKARITYRPNVAKRLKKHGLLTRLSTRRGIVMLWNKVLKGRHNLST